MTDRRPDADRVQAVGVNVFELREGIRARDTLPPRPGLVLRIGRRARLALGSWRKFLARNRPVVRNAGERVLHFTLALAGSFGRGVWETPPRVAVVIRRIHFDRRRREIPSASPTPETTIAFDEADRDDPSLLRALARLATREYAYGANHPNVASELHFIGALHHEGGRYDEALAYYGQALAIRERTLSPDHPELASTLEDLAATRQAQGESAEAEQLLTRARHLRVRYRNPLLDKTDLKPQFARENP